MLVIPHNETCNSFPMKPYTLLSHVKEMMRKRLIFKGSSTPCSFLWYISYSFGQSPSVWQQLCKPNCEQKRALFFLSIFDIMQILQPFNQLPVVTCVSENCNSLLLSRYFKFFTSVIDIWEIFNNNTTSFLFFFKR